MALEVQGVKRRAHIGDSSSSKRKIERMEGRRTVCWQQNSFALRRRTVGAGPASILSTTVQARNRDEASSISTSAAKPTHAMVAADLRSCTCATRL